MRTLVVFEDAAVRAFEILTPLRGVFDLRCGARTLVERLSAACAADELVLLARPEVCDLLAESHPNARIGAHDPTRRGEDTPVAPRRVGLDEAGSADDTLFANGRLLALGKDLERLTTGPAAGFAVVSGDVLVAARCRPQAAARLARTLQSALGPHTPGMRGRLQRQLPDLVIRDLAAEPGLVRDGSSLIEHVWDLVDRNPAALADDFAQGPPAGVAVGARVDPGVRVLQPTAVRVAAGARIRPGVVLDAEAGPITIETGVDIQPNVVVCGPACIGPDCLIRAGAKIHAGTSLGPVCKFGGEVGESIVQGYSNKQHDGFLGHAWIGEWVNLGADTNNSDLKNNYSSVRVWEAGEFVDTGLMFVGLIAADHVKSAINTQFNTGTVVGLSSQIFGAGFPPKFVPPFSWGGAEGLEAYDYDKALRTARAVMARRKRQMTPAYEAAFRLAFERWRAGVSKS